MSPLLPSHRGPVQPPAFPPSSCPNRPPPACPRLPPPPWPPLVPPPPTTEALSNPERFALLDDSIVRDIERSGSQSPAMKKAQHLLWRLRLRDIYKVVGVVDVPQVRKDTHIFMDGSSLVELLRKKGRREGESAGRGVPRAGGRTAAVTHATQACLGEAVQHSSRGVERGACFRRRTRSSPFPGWQQRTCSPTRWGCCLQNPAGRQAPPRPPCAHPACPVVVAPPALVPGRPAPPNHRTRRGHLPPAAALRGLPHGTLVDTHPVFSSSSSCASSPHPTTPLGSSCALHALNVWPLCLQTDRRCPSEASTGHAHFSVLPLP